jgi:cobalt-zinc-cadmium efflux system membrane fusion protein
MRRLFAVAVVAAALAAAGWFVARPFLTPARPDEEPEKGGAASENQTVPLSEQAQKTLGLVSKPVGPTTFWKKLTVPGSVIDRPGVSDRGVTAPVAGVVTRVRVTPGDVVRPGEELFELRITSEFIYATQANLHDVVKAAQSQQRKIKRLEASGGAVAEEQVIAAKGELNKLNRQVSSFRQLLQSQGLTTPQIDSAETGKFLDRLIVNAPAQRHPLLTSKTSSDGGSDFAYEVQDLKAQLGNQVMAGQVLAVLANHRLLFIEGRAFKSEMPQIEKAAKEGWPIEVEMPSGEDNGWATLKQTLHVRSLGNVVDVKSRTVPFFLPLVNEARDYERDGKTFLAWRFRPGQRVRLHVPVERLDDVIVLPINAVAREGAEAFVFRQNGDAFDRKPVVVLYEDRRHVVLTKDSVAPGMYVAMNNAAALNRALKSAAGAGGGHHHHH